LAAAHFDDDGDLGFKRAPGYVANGTSSSMTRWSTDRA